ncbi:MAG: hypothetical protein RIU46_11890 [Deltaproteobacteria bacterium]
MDFGAVEATAAVDVTPAPVVYGLIALTLVAWAALILISARVAMARGGATTSSSILSRLAPSLKLVVSLTLVAGVFVQLMAAGSVWSQTKVANASAYEYFQYLSTARLFGISHAHLFGFAVIYGFNALLLSLSGAAERTKCLLVATICWSGMFDVLSWWGIREVSENFEIVSIVSGSGAGIGWLVSSTIVVRDLWRRS